MLRTIGFSSSPGLIRVLGIIPGLSFLVYSVAAIWMLAAMVVAVKQVLDYHSTWRAVGVCIIGWIIQGLTNGPVFFNLWRCSGASLTEFAETSYGKADFSQSFLRAPLHIAIQASCVIFNTNLKLALDLNNPNSLRLIPYVI